MRRVKRAVKKQEHEKITFEMGAKERAEAFKKKQELAARAVRLEAKRVKGLAHYQQRIKKAKQQGRWKS